jgi:DNA-binding MarR family transcriptional regulator
MVDVTPDTPDSIESSSLAVRLRRAEAALRDRLLPILAENGLGMEHWRIIAVVDDQPGIGMRSVAATAVVPAATLTRHMDKLVEHGVVVRHVDPADKRRVVVALSHGGRALAVRLREAERLAAAPAVGVLQVPTTVSG